MEVVKVRNGNFSPGVEGVVVAFDNDTEAHFYKYGVHYFQHNDSCVSARVIKICRKEYGDVADGCMVELRESGRATGERAFFPFTAIVQPKKGYRVATQDGIGKIVEIAGYSDFWRFGVKFVQIPVRFESMVEAGYLKNGLVYYTSNEVDLIVG